MFHLRRSGISTKTEILDGDEKPTCENCKERRKCKKWYSVERWPTILVIHLKRFAPAGGYRPKICCVIDVSLKNLNFRYKNKRFICLKAFTILHSTKCIANNRQEKKDIWRKSFILFLKSNLIRAYIEIAI